MRDKVIISNGFGKFHLPVAAEEAFRRGRLARFITGAYTTEAQKQGLSALGLAQSGKLGRLLQRSQDIPAALITSLWLSEALHQTGLMLMQPAASSRIGASLGVFSCHLYARRSVRAVRGAAGAAGLFHYRAGFGHAAARAAKAFGMVTLCDHSIVHPALLDYFIENEGRFPPPGGRGQMTRFWSDVLEDITQADAVLVNSDFVKETFLHQGWDPARVHVLYWGIDNQFLKAVPPTSSQGADVADPTTLLFAGFFGRRKGAHVLIRALERIDDAPWRLEIAGPVEQDIKNRYSGFFADSRVKLAGTVLRDELARRMGAADVFVFPSLAEGSARVAFEALACACYVITTPNSGSIVEQDVHGALVAPGDVPALEAAIRAALSARGKLAEIGRSNAETIRSRWRQQRYGEALFALYNKLLRGHNDDQ